jgi:hypothetical protein
VDKRLTWGFRWPATAWSAASSSAPTGTPSTSAAATGSCPTSCGGAVELRDGQCAFAGCDAPSYWCDVHHLLHWIDGGETNLENSALLCESHHTKVHHGFRVERRPDGRWRTYRPDDTEILIGTPLLI